MHPLLDERFKTEKMVFWCLHNAMMTLASRQPSVLQESESASLHISTEVLNVIAVWPSNCDCNISDRAATVEVSMHGRKDYLFWIDYCSGPLRFVTDHCPSSGCTVIRNN